jgi:hypothetical protein
MEKMIIYPTLPIKGEGGVEVKKRIEIKRLLFPHQEEILYMVKSLTLMVKFLTITKIY